MPKYRQLHTKIVDSFDFNEMPDDFTPKRDYAGMPAQRKGPGYVYIMRGSDGNYKIGSTVRPLKRNYEVSHYGKVKTTIILLAFTDNMNILERLLHKTFSHKKIWREWFSLSSDDLIIIRNIMSDSCR
jgi:predicted GIY-YIG superfamily endonuclease